MNRLTDGERDALREQESDARDPTGRFWRVLWLSLTVCGIAGVVLGVRWGAPLWGIALAVCGAAATAWAAGVETAARGRVAKKDAAK